MRGNFNLQNEGIALAFRDPEVLQAVDNLKPFGAAIAVVQWGGAGETQVVLPFTHIEKRQGCEGIRLPREPGAPLDARQLHIHCHRHR